MSSETRVRPFRPGDEVALCELFERVFSEKRSLEWWRWQWDRSPSRERVIQVIEKDGEIMAHVGVFTVHGYFDGRPVRVAYASDFMVDPRLQVSTLGLSVARAAYDGIDGRGWATIGVGGRRYPAAVLQLFGATHAGSLPRFVRPLSAKGIEAGLGKALPAWLRLLANAAVRTWSALVRLFRPRMHVGPLGDPGAELDRLARESASYARWIRLRDSAYVHWRWLEQPQRSWQLRGAWSSEGHLAGYVVFGVDKEVSESTPVGRIVDILAGDARTVRALLATSCEALAREGCGLVLLDYADVRPWARRACLLSGFVPYGEGPHFTWRPPPGSGIDPSKGLTEWYLTAGDSDFI